jgi:imidazolonepropionase-like amidohydrolase
MGLAHDVGAIVPGRMADIIAVQDNPLTRPETLRDVPVVLKAGVIVKKR